MSITTKLNFNLREFEVNPYFPSNTDIEPEPKPESESNQDAPDTGDHGFFTSESTRSENIMTSQIITTASFILFVGIVLVGFIIPKLLQKHQKNDSSRYVLKRSGSKRFQILSAIFASVSLLAGIFTSAFGYTIFSPIETSASENLFLNSDIIGTDNIAYVHDTITIPTSKNPVKLYIYAEDSSNKLASETISGASINSVEKFGALTENSFGFSFVDPKNDPTKFNPVQNSSSRLSVLDLSSEDVKEGRKIDIWYGVRSKTAIPSLYTAEISIEAIEFDEISFEEMTQSICKNLEEGVFDYTFRNDFDDKEYSVVKLKDGNCWAKQVPTASEDSDEPSVLTCPTGWRNAKENDYLLLNHLYDLANEETNPLVADLSEGESCVADYSDVTISFVSDTDEETTIPASIEESVNEAGERIITLPEAPESSADGQEFLGWSLTPEGEMGETFCKRAGEEESVSLCDPGDEILVTSPDFRVHAIFSKKTPKAILDSNNLMNFVYDYYSVDDVNNNKNNYKTRYEESLEENGTVEEVFLVEKNVVAPSWYRRTYRIEKIKTDPSFKEFEPESTSTWFAVSAPHTAHLKTADLSNLNTTKTSHMKNMFSGEMVLEEVVLPSDDYSFGTFATDMSGMFSNTYILKSLDLPKGFGMNAENLSGMFHNSLSLKELDLPEGFGMKATNLSHLFLVSLDALFELPPQLEKITLPKGFGQQATDLSEMFSYATALKEIEFPDGFAKNVIITEKMFLGTTNLEAIYVESGTDWKNDRVENSNLMFGHNTLLPNYNDENDNNIENAHIGDTNGTPGYFTDKCVLYGTCQEIDSSNLTSTSSQFSAGPTSFQQNSGTYNNFNTNTENSSEPENTNNQTTNTATNVGSEEESNTTKPLGVIRTSEKETIDYPTIIVTAVSSLLAIVGGALIVFIEKKNRDEEDY